MKDMAYKGKRTKNGNHPNGSHIRTKTGGYQSIDDVSVGSVSKVERMSKPESMNKAGYEKTYRAACHDSDRKLRRSPPYDDMKRNNY